MVANVLASPKPNGTPEVRSSHRARRRPGCRVRHPYHSFGEPTPVFGNAWLYRRTRDAETLAEPAEPAEPAGPTRTGPPSGRRSRIFGDPTPRRAEWGSGRNSRPSRCAARAESGRPRGRRAQHSDYEHPSRAVEISSAVGRPAQPPTTQAMAPRSHPTNHTGILKAIDSVCRLPDRIGLVCGRVTGREDRRDPAMSTASRSSMPRPAHGEPPHIYRFEWEAQQHRLPGPPASAGR